jgi:hypothetical protein
MPTADIDFASVKSAITIDQVIPLLNAKLTQHGDQWRGECVACKSGGPRAFVITRSKAAYYCFSAKRGGDAIACVAHARGMSQRDAASLIISHFGLGNSVEKAEKGSHIHSSPEPTGRVEGKSPLFKAMAPLLYLDAHHESVQALGIEPETAEYFKAGYANRGVLRGRFCVPIHAMDGMLIAYVGIAVNEEQRPRLEFNNFTPDRYMFNLERVSGDDGVYVARDPLDVLTAYQNGVENVIAFLSPITAGALDVLSVWMQEKGIENVEIL